MVWMYIDAPQDGVMLLVWQPMSKLGIEFASDGYVWADAEQAFSSEARGHVSLPLYCLRHLHSSLFFVRRWKCISIEAVTSMVIQ